LRGKLDKIHQEVKNRMGMTSSRIKGRYDRKDRDCSFGQGQKVWFYNPRRKEEKPPNYEEIGRAHTVAAESILTSTIYRK